MTRPWMTKYGDLPKNRSLLLTPTSDLAITCYETSSEQHALSASRLNLTKEKHKGKINQKKIHEKYEAKSLANNCMNFDPPVPTE